MNKSTDSGEETTDDVTMSNVDGVSDDDDDDDDDDDLTAYEKGKGLAKSVGQYFTRTFSGKLGCFKFLLCFQGVTVVVHHAGVCLGASP